MKKILNFAPATKNFNEELLSLTDYLILNEVEVEELSQVEIKTVEDAKRACLSLLDKHGVKLGVIVTLGEKGVLYVDRLNRNSFHKPTEKVTVVDTSVNYLNSVLFFFN